MTPWLVFSVLATAQDVQQGARIHSVQGDLEIVKGFVSRILSNSRDIRILLPEGYERDATRRYPVLYLNDGQNLFDGTTSFLPNKEWRVDETSRALAEAGLVEKLIIVGVDNAGTERANEYLPTRQRMDNGEEWGGKAELYGKFLTDELMPYVNKRFRTKTGPRFTGLGGSSFGGVLTLDLGLKHPDFFGRLAVVSPSLWWDDQVMLRQVKAIAKRPDLKIWLDVGTKEGANSVSQTLAVRDALVNKGWRLGQSLACVVDQGAVHNEDAWAARFGMVLMFLFPAH